MALAQKLHDDFSRYITPALLKVYQVLRPSRQRTARFFKEGLQFRINAARWDDPQKARWILLRLREVLRHAAAATPFYSDLFGKIGFDPNRDFSFSDFAAVPVLERSAILNAGESLIARNIPRGHLRRDASGGSTGEPAKIWVGPEEMGWHLSAHRFFLEQLGLPPGSRIAYLWGHHLDPGHNPSLAQRFFSFARNERWFDCFRLSSEIFLEYHREMEQFQPDCIIAYASALGGFAEFLKQKGIAPGYPHKCIITGAEKLFAFQRTVAQQVFKRPIYERYGARDAGVVGYQLPGAQAEDFVVDWSNVLVEPEIAHEESSILITKLHTDGMPMIRYRVGDVGRFPEGSAPGHPVLRLPVVIGRNVDRVWLPDGSFIHGIQFPHLFKDFPVREFMATQMEDYSLEVQIIPADSFSEGDRNSIQATISKNLPGLPVRVEVVQFIPRTIANKWRPVVTRVVPNQAD